MANAAPKSTPEAIVNRVLNLVERTLGVDHPLLQKAKSTIAMHFRNSKDCSAEAACLAFVAVLEACKGFRLPNQNVKWEEPLKTFGVVRHGKGERLISLFNGRSRSLERFNVLWRTTKFVEAFEPSVNRQTLCHSTAISRLNARIDFEGKSGKGQIMEIVGEGGIGKTALLYFLRATFKKIETRSHISAYVECSIAEQRQKSDAPITGLLGPLVESAQQCAPDDNLWGRFLQLSSDRARAKELGELFSKLSCILVIDGIDALSSQDGRWIHEVLLAFLSPLSFEGSLATVIMTSRWSVKNCLSDVETVHLERMDLAASGNFLKSLEVVDSEAGTSSKIAQTPGFEADEKAFGDLAKECCCLPIYLILYGVLVARSGTPIRNYASVLKHDRRVFRTSNVDQEFHRKMLSRYVEALRANHEEKELMQDAFELIELVAMAHRQDLNAVDLATIFWDQRTCRFKRAKDRLETLRLLDVSEGLIAMHPEVKEFFRERSYDPAADLSERRSKQHRKYFAFYLGKLTANRFVFADVIACLRHGCDAGLFKEVIEILRSPKYKLSVAQSPGAITDRLELFQRLRNDLEMGRADSLNQSERFFLLIQLAGTSALVRGMASSDVQNAATAAKEVANEGIEKAICEIALWRSSLVRAQFDLLPSHITVLRTCAGRDRPEVEEYWSEVIENAELYAKFYTAAGIAEVAKFRPPHELDDGHEQARDNFLRTMGTVYDPRISGRLFAGWATAICGDVCDGRNLIACALEQSSIKANGTASYLLSMYFQVALEVFAGDAALAEQYSEELIEKASAIGEDFLIHGARFHKAQLNEKLDPRVRFEHMEGALHDWQKSGARLMTPFFATELAAFAMRCAAAEPNERAWLEAADRALTRAAEGERRGEIWYRPITQYWLSRLLDSRGNQVESTAMRSEATRFSLENGLLLYSRIISDAN